MRRTRPMTCMIEPEIYSIISQEESNISQYLHDLAIADLIKRKLLTAAKLKEIYEQEDSIPEMPLVQDAVS